MGMLDGLRVLDFTWAWAGPYGTTLLALAGAEVLKLESRARLDMIRRSQQRKPDGEVLRSSFDHINLNKRSLTLNLSHPKGVALARELARVCDLVTENYRPGVMEKMGLGYRELRALKPDLMMVSISTRGATGPERRYGGYATVFASLSGLSHMTGYPDGPPTQFRNSMDICSGYTLAIAALGAIYAWRRTGRGQHVDTSASEAAISLIGDSVLAKAMGCNTGGRRNNDDAIMAPHNCYPCQGEDRWVSIAVSTEEEWRALCSAMGNPAWTREERFADTGRRWLNRAELDRHVAAWTRGQIVPHVAETLQKAGVAAFPAVNGEDVIGDPHLVAREKFHRGPNPDREGDLAIMNPPWRHSATPTTLKRAGMPLGEDNSYVFGELLALSAKEQERLQAERVIY